MKIRPIQLRRSWLFVGATNENDIKHSYKSEADVCILEFEDFCAPKERPLGRKNLPKILEDWKKKGKVTAVRINPLDTSDGLKDLDVAISKNLDVILLPKVNNKKQIEIFLEKKRYIENRKNIKKNKIEFIPNIETAQGLENIKDILNFDEVKGALVASEDMAISLGVLESKNNDMLNFVRKRFHLACSAYKKYSIDMPFTWKNNNVLKEELKYIKNLGILAKSSINAAHCKIINKTLTPTLKEANEASEIIKQFNKVLSKGKRQILFKNQYLELPAYNSALKILNRYNEFIGYNKLTKYN